MNEPASAFQANSKGQRPEARKNLAQRKGQEGSSLCWGMLAGGGSRGLGGPSG